jgi:hypothetical protein
MVTFQGCLIRYGNAQNSLEINFFNINVCTVSGSVNLEYLTRRSGTGSGSALKNILDPEQSLRLHVLGSCAGLQAPG